MRFALKHLFLLLLVLGVGGMVALQAWRSRDETTREQKGEIPPNLSILVTRLPGTDLLHLFVQNLDPSKGTLISQEVFTLQRLGSGATIAHYTSSSPHFISPAAVSQKRPDGTVLPPEQQTALQTWMREQLEVRLRQLDQALQRRTMIGVFVALRLVHDGQEVSRDQERNLRPWVFLPAKQIPNGDSASQAAATDLQLRISLDDTAYENLETFAKRLANEFQQRFSSK